MKKRRPDSAPGGELRRRAEESVREQEAQSHPPWAEIEVQRLIHELQVHQAELEMQNEELRQAQIEAEQLREKYQDLYDFAPVGYLTLDAAGMVTEANLAAASLLGYERRRIVGRPLLLFLTPDSRGGYDSFLRYLLVGGSGVRCEVRLGANAKREGWLLLEGGTSAEHPGRVALIDITERKRFEKELIQAREAAEAASRAKEQFLANMSHELRTPMTGVIGMLDLALDEEISPKLRSYLEISKISARALLHLLNDILVMTKIDTGRLSLEETPFPLRKCLAGVVGLLAPEARRKGLHLVLAMADDLPENAVGDGLRLQQILTNLAGNAVKFTGRGFVKIAVTAGAPDSAGRREYTFTVTDTGIGISPDKRDTIFQMFSQADTSHTRRFGGAGLGLAISREIAALMGGAISYAGNEGEGSTFTFTVPLGETGATDGSAGSHLPEPLPGNPRLLLVEDEPTTRQIIELMLRRSNIELDIAVNGQQGIEMWEEGNYDLILMDVQMPGMDGFEATRLIREKERAHGGHIPIIALTAFALKKDEEKCLAAGMDAYVSKPIDFKKCVEIIRGVLGQRS